MADIYKAYQFLNKALGIKLTKVQMSRAEMMFKVELAKRQGFSLSEGEANNVEAFIYFRPRKGMSLLTSSGDGKPAPAKRIKIGAKGG